MVSATTASISAGGREPIALRRGGQERLHELRRRMKADGKGRPYDCILGVSGGATPRTRRTSRRPSTVFDHSRSMSTTAGTASLQCRTSSRPCGGSTSTCRRTCSLGGVRDLQKSFLRAGIANAEIPTDHSIVATLFREAGATQDQVRRHREQPSDRGRTSRFLDARRIRPAVDQVRATTIRQRQVTHVPDLSYTRLGLMLGVRGYKFVNLLNFRALREVRRQGSARQGARMA